MVYDRGRRRSLGDKCQLKVLDDPVHHGIVCDEGDDLHVSSALSTNQRVDFKNFADHLCPAPAGDSRVLLLHDDKGMLIGLCLAHLTPVGVPVEAEISHSDLALVWNVRDDPGDELQVIHPLHLFRLSPYR